MGLDHRLTNDLCGFASGERNLITDVPGVSVGHCTLAEGDLRTGVTAILPRPGNVFLKKLPAAAHVINGFGKSIGLVQIEELGTLETPLILTNTFSVGTAANALIRYSLEQNGDIGDTTGTVNPVVLECNDGFLNDIRAMAVEERHVRAALRDASDHFSEGAVGGGTGMSCYGLKGGIGSASRKIRLDGNSYTLGSLVMTNFGTLRDLTVDGKAVGRKLAANSLQEEDKGSVIVVLATDIPLIDRQIKRLCRRASVGITRTGAFIGNGSGEIVVGFSTACTIPHYEAKSILPVSQLNENKINDLFRATVSAVEESVVSSLTHARTIVGRAGHKRLSFLDAMAKYGEK